MIFVTPYDLKTKACLAASLPAPFVSLDQALDVIGASTYVIRHSKRLLLVDSVGAGIAFSDYRIRYE